MKSNKKLQYKNLFKKKAMCFNYQVLLIILWGCTHEYCVVYAFFLMLSVKKRYMFYTKYIIAYRKITFDMLQYLFLYLKRKKSLGIHKKVKKKGC